MIAVDTNILAPSHLAPALFIGARQGPFAKLVPTVGSTPKSCSECGPLFASKSGSLLASPEVVRSQQ